MSYKFGKIAPPTITKIFTGEEVSQIIRNTLGKDVDITLSDKDYATYSTDELKRFLDQDTTDKLNYQAEKFDCDDFALVLSGREKEWFMNSTTNFASTFGIVHGDIRKQLGDNVPRPHAVNYFIDHNGQLWLIEPQNDKIFLPNASSVFWRTFA